jgi:amino acid transporter
VLGLFASFALAMSTICILAGGLTSFHIAFCSVGGASMGLGWPLGCLFSLTVALTMAQVASAFPRSGGPYQWAAILGGRGWGWLTACFGLVGLITAQAAVNVGAGRFLIGSLSYRLNYNPDDVNQTWYGLAAAAMTVSQGLINHLGMRLTSRAVSLGGYVILIFAAALTGSLLLFGVFLPGHFEWDRLWEFKNYGGAAGKGTWPETSNLAWLFALGLMLPAYTITGFDASAQTAEETVEPERNVPRGIWQAVVISGVAGWVMLCSFILAIPPGRMDECAAAGDLSLFEIIRAVVPQPLRGALYAGIIASMYVCGLAVVTSVSRMTWGFARDGGLPGSAVLRRIGSHGTPSAAIWSVVAVATVMGFLPYGAVAAVCAIFLYIAYVLPTIFGILNYRRWKHLAEWHIGAAYRPLGVVSVLGSIFLIVIGMQPPYDIALWIVAGTLVLLVGLWFGLLRSRFPGPPREVLLQLRPVEDASAAERKS